MPARRATHRRRGGDAIESGLAEKEGQGTALLIGILDGYLIPGGTDLWH